MRKPISDKSKVIKHLIHCCDGVGLTVGDYDNLIDTRPIQTYRYPSADPEYDPRSGKRLLRFTGAPIAPKSHERVAPTSITIYRKIHATGHYLNRLCRGLHIEEPDDPLMRGAKAHAERRYSEVQPQAARILATDLPLISVQACKVRAKLPEIKDRAATVIQRKCNAEIKKAIRRVEKTKAYLRVSDEIETRKQMRRIFQKDVERYHRVLTRDVRKDDLIVPRHWPMRWANGVYTPIATPHEWRPKRKRKALHQIEAGNKNDWARLTRDLGAPPLGWNPKLLAAEKREDRGYKMVGVLIRRQARNKYLNDPALREFIPDSFGAILI